MQQTATYSISREVVKPSIPLTIQNFQDVLLEEFEVLGLGPKKVRADGLMGLVLRWLDLAQFDLLAYSNSNGLGKYDEPILDRVLETTPAA